MKFVSDSCLRISDVTLQKKKKAGEYAQQYAGFPQGRAEFINSEIPVDNWWFSTFSTGFSTCVIHRQSMLWIFIFGSHKTGKGNRTDLPLFWKLCFFTTGKSLCKKSDLTSLVTGGNRVRSRTGSFARAFPSAGANTAGPGRWLGRGVGLPASAGYFGTKKSKKGGWFCCANTL